jgi:hypothetical protein
VRNDYPVRGLVLASGYYFPTWRWDVWMMSGPAIPVLGDLVGYTIGPILSWAILPIASSSHPALSRATSRPGFRLR